jgi:hypothetical protein
VRDAIEAYGDESLENEYVTSMYNMRECIAKVVEKKSEQ